MATRKLIRYVYESVNFMGMNGFMIFDNFNDSKHKGGMCFVTRDVELVCTALNGTEKKDKRDIPTVEEVVKACEFRPLATPRYIIEQTINYVANRLGIIIKE